MLKRRLELLLLQNKLNGIRNYAKHEKLKHVDRIQEQIRNSKSNFR